MDNPEKLAILGPHDTGQTKHKNHNTTPTTTRMGNTGPFKTHR